MGVRYLSEGNYREAIIAFNAAIEIDPKRADAYIGLADVYEAQGDTERARQVLADALTVVADSDAIRIRLDGLEGNEALAPTPGTTVEPTPTPMPAPTPTPKPSVTVVTASGDCGENVTWMLDNDSLLTISGTGPMSDYSFMPWEEVYDFDVTDAPWYEYRNYITKVIIEASVTSIGDCSFSSCYSLVDVTIPNGIINIGESAFYGCFNLTSVTIPDSVIGIEDYAFQRSGLTSITIPNRVTSIGRATFDGCGNLTSVIIPDSVTSMGDFAFSGCSSLTDVYYSGSEAQWNQIAIDGYNDPLINATIHYNS